MSLYYWCCDAAGWGTREGAGVRGNPSRRSLPQDGFSHLFFWPLLQVCGWYHIQSHHLHGCVVMGGLDIQHWNKPCWLIKEDSYQVDITMFIEKPQSETLSLPTESGHPTPNSVNLQCQNSNKRSNSSQGLGLRYQGSHLAYVSRSQRNSNLEFWHYPQMNRLFPL